MRDFLDEAQVQSGSDLEFRFDRPGDISISDTKHPSMYKKMLRYSVYFCRDYDIDSKKLKRDIVGSIFEQGLCETGIRNQIQM